MVPILWRSRPSGSCECKEARTGGHGSWLDLVECFFSKMTRTLLRGIRVVSKAELKNRIERYIEHKSERFAFGYVLYWLARSNRLQMGCSLRGRRSFRNFYFSET
uniref:Uncharacterized protein n=1 Tax=Candidatus Kentrum sp. UNK TaxID=2126344 RepID=A0A451B3T6_9GAMM|nr:MAG: hypothetical protein BECKUNK1418H_GA0071006_11519 [Candidatus Kentron sp. UNK]